MNIIITGAGGFLGQALIMKLSAYKEFNVYALTSQYEKLKDKFKTYSNVTVCKNSELISGNFSFTNRDILVNCAFPRIARGEQFAIGMKYIQEILSVATEKGVGGVINISSQSVYNQQRETAALEEDPISLDSIYATGKYATELLTETICKNCFFCNVRLASLIGPKFDQRVTNKMIDKALETGKISVQKGEQYFGFLDIEDAAEGILSIIKYPFNRWRPIYNLGSKKAYSLLEIATTISDVIENTIDQKINIELIENGESAKLNTSLDSTLIEKSTGYQPSIPLDESIKRILNGKL